MDTATMPCCYPSNGVDEILYAMAELQCVGWMGLVLELRESLDAEVLAAATRLLVDAEPLLGCRLDASGKKPVWRRRDDLDSLEHCRLVRTENPTLAAERQSLLHYDPAGDPLLRLFVFRPDRGADVLLLQVSHAVADAMGAYQLVEQLASIYTRLLSEPDYRPARREGYDWNFPFYDGFSWRDKLRLWSRALAYPFAMALAERKPSRGLRADPSCVFERNSRARPAIVRLRLEKDEAKRLKQAAFRGKYWISDVFMAAFLRAFAAWLPGDFPPQARHRAGSVVNLRRLLPKEWWIPVCNLVYRHVLDIGPRIDEDFSATLAKVVQQNQPLQDPTFVLRDRPLAFALLNLASFENKRRSLRKGIAAGCARGTPPTLSNLGLLDHRTLASAPPKWRICTCTAIRRRCRVSCRS
ncbi:hypothetical protein [Methylogaea oryzae]|uniref:hypothetical protein n=1 Tax=Methylogaea oryzae TaxID=1295382 RepID=UPI0006CF9EA0|nr:hypothetical protein [Methylogaea oryzae]